MLIPLGSRFRVQQLMLVEKDMAGESSPRWRGGCWCSYRSAGCQWTLLPATAPNRWRVAGYFLAIGLAYLRSRLAQRQGEKAEQ